MDSEVHWDAQDLDDMADRDVLRNRYEVLLQELRASLPGVQILSAFLLTAPFSQRFDELDDLGVPFVSASEAFDSLGPAGRLQRIVLSSVA